MSARTPRSRHQVPLRIMLVDDDEGEYLLVRDLLAKYPGRAVTLDWVTASQDALRCFHELGAHDLYLIDYKLLDHTGLDVVRDLRASGCRTPLIMLTTCADDAIDQQAMRAGAADYLIKTEMTRPLLQRSIRHAMDRAEMVKALRQSEERYRSLARNFPNGCILLIDHEGVVQLAEGAGLQALAGTPDTDGSGLAGRPARDVFPGGFGEAIHQHAARALTGKSITAEIAHGGRHWLVSAAPQPRFDSPPLVVVVVKDITAHRATEAHANHRKRLESIGQLAAGVAHELNTPIQFVGDNMRFLSGALAGVSAVLEACAATPIDSLPTQLREAVQRADIAFLGAEVPRAIQQSLDGLERLSSSVSAMRALSDPASSKHPADLNGIVLAALAKARTATNGSAASTAPAAEFTADLDPALPLVACDARLIAQLLEHLLANAAHAIASVADGRGAISVSTKLAGDQVEIRVADNGCGIAEPIRERIFDPFFTTRDVGTGKGQGLFLAHEITVVKHGGSISFSTEVGVGTTFVVSMAF